MNILHIVNIYFVIPYYLGEQLQYFKQKGYNEHIICSPSDEIKENSRIHGFNYEEVVIERKISLKSDIIAIQKIRNYIKKQQINIVTGHTPKGAFLGMIAAWLENVPKRIYFRHGLVYETAKGLKRTLLIEIDKLTSLLATQIINVSPSVADASLRAKLNTTDKQIILNRGTCNGISTEKFDKHNIDVKRLSYLKNDVKIENNDFVIGYTGRLVRDKGVIELVDAFNLIQNSFPNVKLLLVGMFEERDKLPNETVKSIKNNPNIIHIGYVSYEIIEYYYALMDIFVLPSYREGFPTSVLEASAMNLPVITTNVTGCKDSIIDRETGLFVGHDKEEIALAIKFLLTNKKQRIDYGIKGRKFVKDNFSCVIIWNEIEKIYLQ